MRIHNEKMSFRDNLRATLRSLIAASVLTCSSNTGYMASLTLRPNRLSPTSYSTRMLYEIALLILLIDGKL